LGCDSQLVSGEIVRGDFPEEMSVGLSAEISREIYPQREIIWGNFRGGNIREKSPEENARVEFPGVRACPGGFFGDLPE